MDIAVFNKDLVKIDIIDVYGSFIWTDRDYQCGDFELTSDISQIGVASLQNGEMLQIENSDRTMIVEGIEFKTETGDDITKTVIVTGRSLESILDRRIVWDPADFNCPIQDAIYDILYHNVISPNVQERKIDNFVFRRNDNPILNDMVIQTQCYGDNVYEWISNSCEMFGIGFSMTFEQGKIVFQLRVGEDRTTAQTKNPVVLFSPEMDTLVDSDYESSSADYKNVVLVEGRYTNDSRIRTSVSSTKDASGLNRRESFLDASNVNANDEQGNPIPEESFVDSLNQAGFEELLDHKHFENFDANVESSGIYTYGKDYNIGDIVEIQNEFGIQSIVKVNEVTFSDDEDGFKLYPTFESILGGE